MLEVRETLVDRCLCGVCVTVVLDGNTEYPETVVANGVILDPSLVLKDVVDRLGEKTDEGVSF